MPKGIIVQQCLPPPTHTQEPGEADWPILPYVSRAIETTQGGTGSSCLLFGPRRQGGDFPCNFQWPLGSWSYSIRKVARTLLGAYKAIEQSPGEAEVNSSHRNRESVASTGSGVRDVLLWSRQKLTVLRASTHQRAAERSAQERSGALLSWGDSGSRGIWKHCVGGVDGAAFLLVEEGSVVSRESERGGRRNSSIFLFLRRK